MNESFDKPNDFSAPNFFLEPKFLLDKGNKYLIQQIGNTINSTPMQPLINTMSQLPATVIIASPILQTRAMKDYGSAKFGITA